MDIRVARDVGPLSSLCKKGRNCLFVINGRRWAWVLHLFEAGVEVDGLSGTRRLDVVKLARFGTPQTVAHAVDGALAASRTGLVSRKGLITRENGNPPSVGRRLRTVHKRTENG